MKKLNEITIADLMPDSISGDAQVSATARAIDPQLRLISEAVDKPLILPAIDDLSEGVLEHLAVQYDVTAWDSAWPIDTKRAVLKTAIADKRKMGTRGAVQRAIEAIAPIATITEWWQDTSGEMPPHTFKIDILQDESAVDAETQASVIAQVNEAKPVRSHFTFNVGQLFGGDLYFAGVLRAISYARVRSAGISIEQTSIDAGVLAALRGMNIRRILAKTHMGEMPEPVVPDVALFGGNFTTGDTIDIDSVDGGGELIARYAKSREIMPPIGWDDGGSYMDDAVPLPRVIGVNGFIGDLSTPKAMTLVQGDSCYLYVNNALFEIAESNVSIAIFKVSDSSSNVLTHVDVSCERTDNRNVKLTNISETALTDAYTTYLYICYESGVEIVDVFDANGVAHNAFKKTWYENEYYWICDGATTRWVNDIEAIGYTPYLNVDVTYGDAVTVPTGYNVHDVQSGRLYIKADTAENVSSLDNDYRVHFVFNGENIYCETQNSMLIRRNTDCLGFYIHTTDTGGYPITYIPSSAPGTSYASNWIVSELNSNNVFLDIVVNFSSLTYRTRGRSESVNRCVLIRRYVNGEVVPYFFVVSPSIWSYENDTFAWVGDITDNSDLAFYYNAALPSMRIRCARIKPVLPEYSEITLYTQYKKTGNGNDGYSQYNVTNATIQLQKTNTYDTVHELYTDEQCTQPFVPDLAKIYKRGAYTDGVWKPLISDVSEMPDTTTNSTTDRKNGVQLLHNGLCWYFTNYNAAIALGYIYFTYRVYNDTRMWTQHALHMKNTSATSDNSITCYSSPIPTASTKTKELYVDVECTNRFYPDLDREYRRTNSNYEPYQIQSIFDMPKSTGSQYTQSAAILMMNGSLHFIKSTSGNADWTSIIKSYFISAPKIYSQPTITLDLGYNNQFTAETIESSVKSGYIRNALDLQKAIDFGLPVQTSSSGSMIGSDISLFNVELVGLCDEYENVVYTQMANFAIDTTTSALGLKKTGTYSGTSNYWRVRITKSSNNP